MEVYIPNPQEYNVDPTDSVKGLSTIVNFMAVELWCLYGSLEKEAVPHLSQHKRSFMNSAIYVANGQSYLDAICQAGDGKDELAESKTQAITTGSWYLLEEMKYERSQADPRRFCHPPSKQSNRESGAEISLSAGERIDTRSPVQLPKAGD